MGCGQAKHDYHAQAYKTDSMTFTATCADLGLKLSTHTLGDYVVDAPPGSHGVLIGLREGDVIAKCGKVGELQFPVKYYQGYNRVLLILGNDNEISPACPISLQVLRGAQRPSVIELKPEVKARPSKASTAACSDMVEPYQ